MRMSRRRRSFRRRMYKSLMNRHYGRRVHTRYKRYH